MKEPSELFKNYGLKLKNANSWPKKTEKYLHADGYTNLEILNGGMPGLNTTKEYYLFEKFFYQYNPDMVIIAFLINDGTVLCSNCGAIELKYKLEESIKKQQYKRKFGLYTLNYIKLQYLKLKLTKATIKEYIDPYEHNSMEFRQCKEAFLKFKEISKNIIFG